MCKQLVLFKAGTFVISSLCISPVQIECLPGQHLTDNSVMLSSHVKIKWTQPFAFLYSLCNLATSTIYKWRALRAACPLPKQNVCTTCQYVIQLFSASLFSKWFEPRGRFLKEGINYTMYNSYSRDKSAILGITMPLIKTDSRKHYLSLEQLLQG